MPRTRGDVPKDETARLLAREPRCKRSPDRPWADAARQISERACHNCSSRGRACRITRNDRAARHLATVNEVSGAAPVTGMGSSATRAFIKYLQPEVLTTALVESAIVVRTGQLLTRLEAAGFEHITIKPENGMQKFRLSVCDARLCPVCTAGHRVPEVLELARRANRGQFALPGTL